MRSLLSIWLVSSVMVMGCNKPAENSGNKPAENSGNKPTENSGSKPTENSGGSAPKSDLQTRSPGPLELHFVLLPAPRLVEGQNEVPLSDLTAFVVARKAVVTKWVLYLPDDVPVDRAVELFAQFEKAECSGVAVYAENARGDCATRDICVEVGPSGPVQVVTEFTQVFPESLSEYVEKRGRDLLVAKCELGELGPVLRPLLAMCEKKHVRLMESGGLEGMPGGRYVEVLKAFKEVGVKTVSFYGVYVE